MLHEKKGYYSLVNQERLLLKLLGIRNYSLIVLEVNKIFSKPLCSMLLATDARFTY